MTHVRHSVLKKCLQFRLPQKGSGELARRNPMPRESRITFEESTHTYRVDGRVVPRSVTGFLHEYASSFDPTLALQTMKAGRQWPEKRAAFEEQGLGVEDTDFLARWDLNGQVARARGHLLHWQAEQLCNGRPVEEPHSPEFQQASQIYDRLLEKGFEPFRAEVCHSVPATCLHLNAQPAVFGKWLLRVCLRLR